MNNKEYFKAIQVKLLLERLKIIKNSLVPFATGAFTAVCYSIPGVQELGTDKVVLTAGTIAVGLSTARSYFKIKENIKTIQKQKNLLLEARGLIKEAMYPEAEVVEKHHHL